MIKIGFHASTADSSVFINKRGIIIALYDDILIFGKDTGEIESVKDKLKRFHPMKDYGLATKILGMGINWGNKCVRLDQEIYTKQILEEFSMTDCKTKETAMVRDMQALFDNEHRVRLDRKEHRLYRRLVGRLMFLTGATRPDIAFAVNRLAQHLASPRDIHMQAAKHVLRYLKGTASKGIEFSGESPEVLTGWTDAAYANAAGRR